MHLLRNRDIHIQATYLRLLRIGLSQKKEAAIIKAVIGDAEIAIMEIVRHRVKMAVSQ